MPLPFSLFALIPIHSTAAKLFLADFDWLDSRAADCRAFPGGFWTLIEFVACVGAPLSGFAHEWLPWELHDDSFDEPRFSVDDSEAKFEAWISSHGDVRISVRGKSGKNSWSTYAMLGEALRRGHGTRSTAAVKAALATIAKY